MIKNMTLSSGYRLSWAGLLIVLALTTTEYAGADITTTQSVIVDPGGGSPIVASGEHLIVGATSDGTYTIDGSTAGNGIVDATFNIVTIGNHNTATDPVGHMTVDNATFTVSGRTSQMVGNSINPFGGVDQNVWHSFYLGGDSATESSTLTVTNGGVMTINGGGGVGYISTPDDPSTLTVTGPGSRLNLGVVPGSTHSQFFDIGVWHFFPGGIGIGPGHGLVEIKNGASVVSDVEVYFSVGVDRAPEPDEVLGSTGHLTITDPGTTWDQSESMYVSYRTDATLEVLNQAMLTVDKDLYVGQSAIEVFGSGQGPIGVGAEVFAKINNATLLVGDPSSPFDSKLAVINDGVLSIENGSAATVDNIEIRLGGTTSISGLSDVEVRNDLTVGDSSKLNLVADTTTLDIGNDLTLSSGSTLGITLDGNESLSDPFEQILVDNTASLAGTLEVNFINGYTPPMVGQQQVLDFIKAAALNGTFDTVPDRHQGAGLFLDVVHDFNADIAQLVLLQAIGGDADGDGDVDNTDIGIVFGNFTGPGSFGKLWVDGDFDGDGDVDNSDIGVAFGNFTGPAPEPTSLGLIAMGSLFALVRRPKGRFGTRVARA